MLNTYKRWRCSRWNVVQSFLISPPLRLGFQVSRSCKWVWHTLMSLINLGAKTWRGTGQSASSLVSRDGWDRGWYEGWGEGGNIMANDNSLTAVPKMYTYKNKNHSYTPARAEHSYCVYTRQCLSSQNALNLGHNLLSHISF